jgi:hypothetical protein
VERAWCGGGVEGSVRCLTYTKERWSQFWNKIGSYGLPVTAKGGKMNYADYLIRQGERLFEGGGTRWKIYHKALVPASPIPTFTQLTLEEAKAILNQSNAHFIRWSSDPTEEPTTWWWNVCSSYDKSKLSSNTRSKIKRGTRLCTVDRVSASWLAQHGYECYVSAFQRYTNASPEPFESFRTRIMETADYEDLFQYWAVFCEGRLVGYVKCDIEPKKGVSTNVLKYNPEGLKQYASYALMDTLLTSYVVERALPINNGERTVLHDSNMQDFLLKFGFRRHYCRLNIIYSSPLHHVVNLVYPFRSLVQRLPKHSLFIKVKALLVQESYRRGSLPTAPGGTSRSLELGQPLPDTMD